VLTANVLPAMLNVPHVPDPAASTAPSVPTTPSSMLPPTNVSPNAPSAPTSTVENANLVMLLALLVLVDLLLTAPPVPRTPSSNPTPRPATSLALLDSTETPPLVLVNLATLHAQPASVVSTTNVSAATRLTSNLIPPNVPELALLATSPTMNNGFAPDVHQVALDVLETPPLAQTARTATTTHLPTSAVPHALQAFSLNPLTTLADLALLNVPPALASASTNVSLAPQATPSSTIPASKAALMELTAIVNPIANLAALRAKHAPILHHVRLAPPASSSSAPTASPHAPTTPTPTPSTKSAAPVIFPAPPAPAPTPPSV
jgi:hypothetical protein